MIDFKEIPSSGDTWELFARDFLLESGFYIESVPDRGPDAGKDLLVTEELTGNLNKYKFRWLVSCKHFAKRDVAVNEKNELNIIERLSTFKADGFIGFYSTLASSGLNSRLNNLRNEKKIKDFTIFDHKAIENLLLSVGYSKLLLRYFPQSYKTVKPLHLITDQYEPLKCRVCEKDLLMALFKSEYHAILVEVFKYENTSGKHYIQDAYCACKGDCDRSIDLIAKKSGLMTGWTDISDLVIPIEFLRYLFAMMNRIRTGHDIYTDEAFDKEKSILINLAQKVLRETTEKERKRFKILKLLPG